VLLDLTAIALKRDPELSNFTGRVSDSGEGRWTAIAAIDEACPPTSSRTRCSSASSRAARATTRQDHVAMRMEFGGHHEKPAADRSAAGLPSR